MMIGWIKLYRNLLEKTIWKNSTPEQKTVLVTLLLMANHSKKEWEWNGEKFTCKPGQLITSLSSIQENCGKGISIKNVRSALNRFEKLGFLANRSTKNGRLITIINWNRYQSQKFSTGIVDGNQQAKKGQRGGNRLAANKNDKNLKNRENEKNIWDDQKNRNENSEKSSFIIEKF